MGSSCEPSCEWCKQNPGIRKEKPTKCNTKVKITAYKASVHPKLEYTASVLDPHQAYLVGEIISLGTTVHDDNTLSGIPIPNKIIIIIIKKGNGTKTWNTVRLQWLCQNLQRYIIVELLGVAFIATSTTAKLADSVLQGSTAWSCCWYTSIGQPSSLLQERKRQLLCASSVSH